jgi:hypothetical protein
MIKNIGIARIPFMPFGEKGLAKKLVGAYSRFAVIVDHMALIHWPEAPPLLCFLGLVTLVSDYFMLRSQGQPDNY